jgi:asparagine synthetase B (glutamine-hydrolysing)
MLLDLITQAVKDSLSDDCGFLLSGGLDSSTVVCAARSLGHEITTFTGYYNEYGFSERPYAGIAAGHDHHEILITPDDFIMYFDEMKSHIRPPYQGVGTFGQYMVAKYASQHVKTLLSGEGADELFGGYARLQIVAGHEPPLGYEGYVLPPDYPCDLVAALQYDLDRLPDLLSVDDQVCAAHGIRAVAPFTDPRIVEYALALPPKQRVGKTVLREAVRGLVPDQIIDRKDKMGFPAPFVLWAQDPLREFIGDRIGYIPDPFKPYDRQWWLDMLK